MTSTVPPNAVSLATTRLRVATSILQFSAPVAHVYRPLEYASAVAEAYDAKFGNGHKEVVFVGMNPGPFGMGQVGVPFGEVGFVRDWMKLRGTIAQPKSVHAKRPIEGFACTRSEVSGQRLWAAIAAQFPAAEDFFARGFVVNYCPLLFLSATGANVTPDKLSREEQRALEAPSDAYLIEVMAALQPRVMIGVGQYAEKRLQLLFGKEANIACIPHPSPASPAANRGWAPLAAAALERAGVHGFM
jgi:single-strand selective monofunctional uracil DNA glycosylase